MKDLLILAILAITVFCVHSSTVVRPDVKDNSSKKIIPDKSNSIASWQSGHQSYGGHVTTHIGVQPSSGGITNTGGRFGKVSQPQRVSALAHGGAHTLVHTGPHHGHSRPPSPAHGNSRPTSATFGNSRPTSATHGGIHSSGGSSAHTGSGSGKVNVPHANSKPSANSGSGHGKVNVPHTNSKPVASTHGSAHSSGGSSHGTSNVPHSGTHSVGGSSGHSGSAHGNVNNPHKVPATVQGGPHTIIGNVNIPQTTTHRPRTQPVVDIHGHGNTRSYSGHQSGKQGVKVPSTNYQLPAASQGGVHSSGGSSVHVGRGQVGGVKVPSTNYQPPPLA